MGASCAVFVVAFVLVGRWNAVPNPPDKVSVSHTNVLRYASNAYFTTLLKNYTTQALGAHVLWTIRYLTTAAGGNWGQVRQDFAATLCKKDKNVAQCLQATAGALPHGGWLVDTVHELLQRWNAVAGPTAKYTKDTSPSAALHLRWWCLRLLRHTQGAFPEGIPVVITKKRGREVLEVDIVVHPKYFKLTPICKRAAPFITLDNLWAQRVLGLSTLAAHGPEDPGTMEFDDGETFDIHASLGAIDVPEAPGKKKGRPKTHEHLEDRLDSFRPLGLIFGQASVVKRWLKDPHGGALPFPSTLRTDGVQLHEEGSVAALAGRLAHHGAFAALDGGPLEDGFRRAGDEAADNEVVERGVQGDLAGRL